MRLFKLGLGLVALSGLLGCKQVDVVELRRTSLFGAAEIYISTFDSGEYGNGGNTKNCTWIADLLNEDHKKNYTGTITYYCVHVK